MLFVLEQGDGRDSPYFAIKTDISPNNAWEARVGPICGTSTATLYVAELSATEAKSVRDQINSNKGISPEPSSIRKSPRIQVSGTLNSC
jgi:hypothetical protein